MSKELVGWFDHGLGDCVQFAFLMKLYQQRGYGPIKVHYERNKYPVFEAAGCEYHPDPINYHHWRYYDRFNQPAPDREGGSGNKAYLNLNTEWLPDLGGRDDQWAELSAIDLEDSFDRLITPEVRQAVAKFLADLPRPVVLLHTRGTNMSSEKSLPDKEVSRLYRLLLDGMEGSLVLLDWDFRVPSPAHGRIRHTKRDWGHLSVLELAALISAADLLIGIDSGPWHLANMTRTPALGVFHNFFPWCVSLPRASGKSAVMTRDSHAHATVNRRKVWNPIEYPAPMPAAEEIARHALRMLAGPRYGLPAGRDAMLQHLVRDRLFSSTSTSPLADRNNSMDILFREMAKMAAPVVVETGCVRSPEDWTAGYSTYLFGAFLDGKRGGSLVSVDLDRHHCDTARTLCRDWDRVSVVCSDSVAYLEARTDPIDVLFLDSMDCEVTGHQEHGLKEAVAGERLVRPGGLMAFDDTAYSSGWTGKGALAVPHLLGLGWTMVGSGYQCILKKPGGE